MNQFQGEAITAQKLKGYLEGMKEYWKLRQNVKESLVNNWNRGEPSKQAINLELRKILDGGKIDKLKLILKNAVGNYKTDMHVVDPQDKAKIHGQFVRWPIYLQEKVENAFDMVEDELRLLKKSHKEKTEFIARHIVIFDATDILTFFGNGGSKQSSEKLQRFETLYFQIPNPKTLRLMFKELDMSQFAHVGGNNDELVSTDKEKSIDKLISLEKEEISTFEYNLLLKTGLPTTSRYKFLKRMSRGWRTRAKRYKEIDLSESEVEIFRFILYQDTSVSKLAS